jgi:signal transduction histidine kinase
MSENALARAPADFEELDLSELVHAVCREMRPRAEAARIDFKTTIPLNSPMLRGDRDTLRAALRQILDHAVDAAPRGGRVAVDVARRAPAQLAVTVADNGMAEAGRDGLAMALRILERHRGTLTMKSEAGRGTVVTALLPTAPPSPIPMFE